MKMFLRVVLWNDSEMSSSAKELSEKLAEITRVFGPETPVFLGRRVVPDPNEDGDETPPPEGVGIVVEIDAPKEVLQMLRLKDLQKGLSSLEDEARRNSWVLNSLRGIKQTLPLSDEQEKLLEKLEREALAAKKALKGRDALFREYQDSLYDAHEKIKDLTRNLRERFELSKHYGQYPPEPKFGDVLDSTLKELGFTRKPEVSV